MKADFIEQTLSRIQNLGGLAKAGISTSTGLTYYDLEAEAKLLYPVLAPIRKKMPRIGKKGAGQGLSVHWNVVTNPNSTGVTAVLEEGKRGAQITPATAARIATYKGIGLEGVTTWEAEWAGEGYDDIRALAQRTTLDSMIIAEEPMLLWGNSGNNGTGLQFGQTPTPTGTGSATGGTLAAGTFYVYCVALSHQGWTLALNQSPNAVVGQITRTNADGSTTTVNGGAAQISAASAGIVVGGTTLGSIAAKVAAVKGAAAYAWFVGASSGAGNAYFVGLTTVNAISITAQPNTGQTANYTGNNTDYSYNPLAFDGLIPQAMSGNGYFSSLDNTAITSDGSNGIVEIDTALKYFWDTYRISPTRIYVGSQLIRDMTKAVLKGSTGSGYRINLQNASSSLGGIVGSAVIAGYVNKFAFGGTQEIPVEIHPNMPDGHIFLDCEVNPYPTANIPLARAVRTRRDYFQVLWPITTRNWQNGVYADECLQVYVPYSMGLISNVAPGVN